MRLFLTLTMLCFGQLALAYDVPPPMSFAKPTADGKHLLVMRRSPLGGDRFKNPIDKRYDRSGLYPVNDPKNPVWTTDWSAEWDRNVVAANDGVHAARVPDTEPGLRHWRLGFERPRGNIPAKPAGLARNPALFVYANGKLTKTVTLGEAFDCAALTDVDCFQGPIIRLDAIEDATGRVWLSLESELGHQSAIVDLNTAAVLQQFGPTAAVGKCGNEGPAPGFFGFGGGSADGRSQVGYTLLAVVAAVVIIGVVFAVVTIWRKPSGPDGV